MTSNDETIRIPDEEMDSYDEMTALIPKLDFMPMEILLKIFAALNDVGLLSVAGTCTRFEPLAQFVFDERYASKYFVIQGPYKNTMYEDLIGQFHTGIKSIEVQKIRRITNRHWIMQLLRKCPIERLKFVKCGFQDIYNALSDHKNITHLSFQGGSAYSFVKLPYLYNLREFKVHHFNSANYADFYIEVIRNNLQLKVIEIIEDSVNEPYQIIECIHECYLNLEQLRLINEAKSLKLSSTKALNAFERVSICVESLGISTDNKNSIEYLRRLSINCKNITRLELFHVDHTLSNGIADVIGLFEQVKSLSLVFKSYEERIVSIVEKLPNLNYLSLKYRCRAPSSNDYVLSLLQKCENLMNIVVDTHFDGFEPKQPGVTREFRDAFIKLAENRNGSVIFELKEDGKIITTVENTKKVMNEIFLED